MPVKEMVRKMTDRRKYVIISDSPDPEYLDDIEETFVRVRQRVCFKFVGDTSGHNTCLKDQQ